MVKQGQSNNLTVRIAPALWKEGASQKNQLNIQRFPCHWWPVFIAVWRTTNLFLTTCRLRLLSPQRLPSSAQRRPPRPTSGLPACRPLRYRCGALVWALAMHFRAAAARMIMWERTDWLEHLTRKHHIFMLLCTLTHVRFIHADWRQAGRMDRNCFFPATQLLLL